MVAGARIAVNVRADGGDAMRSRSPIASGQAISKEGYFEISIRPPPDQWQTRHPVFSVDSPSRVRGVLGRQNARMSRNLCTGLLASNCARSDLHRRIVPYALHLSHRAPRHHVQLVVVFAKPYWGGDLLSILSHRNQRNILLTLNCGWNRFGHNQASDELKGGLTANRGLSPRVLASSPRLIRRSLLC
jgi:hypothetical protein